MQQRTTLTLEADVAAELERRRRSRGTTLKEEVNGLLRAGLRSESERRPETTAFRTKALPLGGPRLESFDDVADVLDLAEGEERR